MGAPRTGHVRAACVARLSEHATCSVSCTGQNAKRAPQTWRARAQTGTGSGACTASGATSFAAATTTPHTQGHDQVAAVVLVATSPSAFFALTAHARVCAFSDTLCAAQACSGAVWCCASLATYPLRTPWTPSVPAVAASAAPTRPDCSGTVSISFQGACAWR